MIHAANSRTHCSSGGNSSPAAPSKRWILYLSSLLLCLPGPGCDDSKNPLSDPQSAKLDQRLVGMWREGKDDDEAVYYHMGPAGDGFPNGMLRIVEIAHKKGKLEPPAEYLAFSTTIGKNDYLNLVLDLQRKAIRTMDENGWKADAVAAYTLMKYHVDGNRLVVWAIDEGAKERAIKSGKIKGRAEPRKSAQFTDTTENVARFVGEAGDRLFGTEQPGRFERVEVGKKP